jgi:hypothetical protein
MAGIAAGCWAGNRVCSEGLSCIFVGPIETAEKARLEALYEQVMTSLKKMIFQERYKGVLRCCFLEIWFKFCSSKVLCKIPYVLAVFFHRKQSLPYFQTFAACAVCMTEELLNVIIGT